MEEVVQTPVIMVYTDGGCHNECGDMKGVGAYAFLQTVDLSQKYVEIYTGLELDTTNNRTEMLAILNAIERMWIDGYRGLIEIYSDSGYVVNGYNNPSYLDKWVQNGWKTSTKKPVLNQDLWQKFLNMPWDSRFHLNLIKGHNKDKNPMHAFWNDICDKACTYTMNNVDSTDVVNVLRYYFDTKIMTKVGEV